MAIPIESIDATYKVYLRGPVPDNTFAFCNVDDYRAGAQHLGLFVEYPEPTDNAGDEFGIQMGGSVTIEVADESDDSDWFLLLEDGSFLLLESNAGRLIQER